jgi:hypothetical protein
MKEATAADVPKDNVMRAIKKATEGDSDDYKEATYEVWSALQPLCVYSCTYRHTGSGVWAL